MIKVHFQRNNIILARIDQQAEIYHSSLSKQDSTKETNITKTNTKKQQKKRHILILLFYERAFPLR